MGAPASVRRSVASFMAPKWARVAWALLLQVRPVLSTQIFDPVDAPLVGIKMVKQLSRAKPMHKCLQVAGHYAALAALVTHVGKGSTFDA